MKLFKKNENKTTNKLQTPEKVKRGFRLYTGAILALTMVMSMAIYNYN